ncbi:hypothetical protein SAMN06265795_12255 [Noviherbaspirillum humi]|uniref:Uncharacterized protein n=1 Tax=Noviherbaspirillum humi TaxID=1688639 RepID=A0A239LH03_9BURK|nr:hypothetical protein [Noviherbaspirillum humi]SNT29158.1 hypothetical protein SAMN06265795_12255 [Noviherbaspirillum humi]
MLPNPIPIQFDLAPGQMALSGVVRLPKIYQGAPYQAAFALQNATDASYRDFSGYDEILMQARLGQGRPVLFELTQSAGTIGPTTVDLDGETIPAFQFDFPAAVTEALELPVALQPQINEVRFVFDVELIADGVVVERLAQGMGLIVVNTTRAA